MASLIAGSPECTINDLIAAMLKSSVKGALLSDWTKLACYLDLNTEHTKPIRMAMLLETITSIEEICRQLIEKWIQKQKDQLPLLGTFVFALEDTELNDIAGKVKDDFYYKTASKEKSQNLENKKSEKSSETPSPIDIAPEELDFVRNVTPFNVEVIRPKKKINRPDDLYKLPRGYKGLALIVNITKFEAAENNRDGATNDTKYMEDLWKDLGYRPAVYEGNFTAEQLGDIVSNFIEKIEEEEDEIKSCVVFIGSHGEYGKIEMSSGSPVNLYNDFIYRITDLETLKGKPKIFIVNACQVFPRTQKDGKMPVEDTVICFSTIPGKEANRDIYLGSWYINCLTRVIMKNAHQLDLENMLYLTQKVMEKIVSEEETGQLPYHKNFLLKTLYFNMHSE